MTQVAGARTDREPTDAELGSTFRLMGLFGLAACVAGSVIGLVALGLVERPAPSATDYVFRQRWTWLNEVAALFILPFPGALVGVVLARRVAVQRRLTKPFGVVKWARVSRFGELLIGLPVAGAIAGALLYTVVNPGPGLITAGVRARPQLQNHVAFEGVAALIVVGATLGWVVGLWLTGLGLRRHAAEAPPAPERVAGAAYLRIGLSGLAGGVVGALAAWALFGLAERPAELVRDAIPARDEQWDWLNMGRHVLVGAAVGLFLGMIAGRVALERLLQCAGLDTLPLGPLRVAWPWLVGLPAVCAAGAAVFCELQNPDRIFDLTLPVVLGLLLGFAMALIVTACSLRDSRIVKMLPGAGRTP